MAKKKKKNKKGTWLSRTAKKAGKGLKKGADVALFAPLLPLRVAMIAGLKVKTGKSYASKSMKEIVTAFHDLVVKQKGHLENYEHLEFFDEEAGVVTNHIVGEIVSGLIAGIVDYFKKLKEKKKKGEQLDPIEAKTLEVGEQAEKVITEKAIEEGKFQLGDFITKNIVIIGLGLLVILYLAFGRKK